MSIITPFLAELDHEARSTARMLERVPLDRLDWAPHTKSMTLGALAWHLAGIPKRVEHMLRVDTFDVAAAGPPAPPTGSLVETYQTNVASVREVISSMSDEALRAIFTMKRGEQILVELPKVGVMRNILMNHSYHHRGQLSVYLRLLDVPVPAMYGSSADEPR
ncbi:MAG TPA: DinB family protein [Thermoanaerobaculia bacterium]|jgi:uncharacterized damage-inducible protein DinB